MRIEIHTEKTFSQYEQFDPLKINMIKLFHVECIGGVIEVDLQSSPEDVFFICKACGYIMAESKVYCRAAMRRLLIVGEEQTVKSITFVPHGK